jgi:hypothetical protein
VPEPSVDDRVKCGVQYFRVKWVDLPSMEDLWQPADATKLVDEYWKRKKQEVQKFIAAEIQRDVRVVLTARRNDGQPLRSTRNKQRPSASYFRFLEACIGESN